MFGANFSADVIKKDGQLIFLCREKLSQLTSTRLIPDETADSLRDSIIVAVLELMPDAGTIVQVDCAPGLQTLAAESKLDGSILKKLGILIDLGRTHNVNKNPVAENAIKEFHKERLKLNAAGGRINEIERTIITKNMNSRIRERGLTSKEMAFNRDQVSNEVKPSDDDTLTKQQTEKREDRHPKEMTKTSEKYKIGDNVFLKSDKSKLRGREIYKIVRLFCKNEEKWAIIQKCESKFMSKEYEVKFSEIFPMPKAKTDIDTDPNDNDENDTESVLDVEENDETESINVNSADKFEAPEHKTNQKEVRITDDPVKDVAVVDEANQQPGSPRPPKRLAALRSRTKMKEFISCLHTEQTTGWNIKTKPPTHGWNYDDWIRDIDDEPYYEEAKVPKDSCIDTANGLVNDDSAATENDELQSPPTTPFQKLLDSLAPNSLCLPEDQSRTQLSMGLLQVFPPVDEDEEMVWDDTTTPPELVQTTEDQLARVDQQLDDATQPRKLFHADDTTDLEDLTSEDSIDDVFDDDSILEVSIDGVRRFRRQNPLRRKLPVQTQATEDTTDTDDEDLTADGIEIDENDQVDTDVPIDATPELRPRRNVQQIDYALYNSTGKKKK